MECFDLEGNCYRMCMYSRVCVHICIHLHMFVCVHAYVFIRMCVVYHYVHMHLCMYAHECIQGHWLVSMHTKPMCVCVYAWSSHRPVSGVLLSGFLTYFWSQVLSLERSPLAKLIGW